MSTRLPQPTISTVYAYSSINTVRIPHLEMFEGEIETDESYFGGQSKGKRGRKAAGKVAVFGLLKRNGKVFTVAIPNTQTATLLPIIREQVKPDSEFTIFHR